MKVFLSWSGERSRLVATALRDWLPLVINEVSPFVSSDIYAGTRWLVEIATELEGTDFGILCVTRENQRMPWLNFEAGALAKAVDTSRVVPLAIDLRPAEIQNPLGQFQSQPLTHTGINKVVSSLNSALPTSLAPSQIERAVTKLWPALEEEIDEVNQKMDLSASVEETSRSDRELLEDVLDSVRSLARIATSPGDPRESPHQAVTPDPHQPVLWGEPSDNKKVIDLWEALRRSVEEARSGRPDAGQPDPKDVDPDGL